MMMTPEVYAIIAEETEWGDEIDAYNRAYAKYITEFREGRSPPGTPERVRADAEIRAFGKRVEWLLALIVLQGILAPPPEPLTFKPYIKFD
jgi:hypothetical protein